MYEELGLTVDCGHGTCPDLPGHEPNNGKHPSGGRPRHTFLKPQEVIARYRWGRTRGYLELKKAGFPRPIGGNYRLDTLIVWEDWCLTAWEWLNAVRQPQPRLFAYWHLLPPTPGRPVGDSRTPTDPGET